MNERIKELVGQAKFMAEETTNKQISKNAELDVFVEKFADLIVEEFRNVLADEYRKTPLECCGHFLRADETIAKHFYGV
jgi:hypothetical protein